MHLHLFTPSLPAIFQITVVVLSDRRATPTVYLHMHAFSVLTLHVPQ